MWVVIGFQGWKLVCWEMLYIFGEWQCFLNLIIFNWRIIVLQNILLVSVIYQHESAIDIHMERQGLNNMKEN